MILLLDTKLCHYQDCLYSIQRSSGHHDASPAPCTHPHCPKRGPDLEQTSVPMLGFGAIQPPQAQRLHELGKFWPWQRLGEDVGYIIIRWYVLHLDFSIFNHLTNEMIS